MAANRLQPKSALNHSPALPQFALFLRPFSSDRRLLVNNPYRSGGYFWPGAVAQPDKISLELLLSDAFKSDTPLIGLGKPGDAIGAGRIESTEEDWQESVRTLAPVARLILAIPSTSSGTKWEIEYLKDKNLLTKCIFVMPPSGDYGVAEKWQESIGELPIFMPPYSAKGMLYSVNADGQFGVSQDLSVSTTRALALRFARVSHIATQEIVKYDLFDQPVFRAVGSLGMMALATMLGFLVLLVLFILIPMFSR